MVAPATKLFWLKRLRVASWLLVFCLPAYWAATDRGLYWVFAEMQIRAFDDHMPLVSWTLSFLITSIPAIYLSGRIDALSTQGFSPEQEREYFRKTYIGDLEKSNNFRQSLRRNAVLFLSLIALVGGVGAGSYFIVKSQMIGPHVTLNVSSLDVRREAPSHFATVTGYPVFRDTVATRRRVQDATFDYFYFPLVEESIPKQKIPLQLIVEIREKWRYQEVTDAGNGGRRTSITGVLSHAFPGVAAAALRRKGWQIPDNVWLLEDRQSPEEYRSMGLAILLVPGGLGALGVGSILLMRRFRKTHSR
jgi:hypothetical protein